MNKFYIWSLILDLVCVDRERTCSGTRPLIKKCLLIYITLVSISSSFRDCGNSFGDPDGTSLKETGGVGDLIGSSQHRGFLGDTHRSPIRKALRDVPWIFGKTILFFNCSKWVGDTLK